MKLYHATKKENEDNILNNGLIATEGMQNALDEIGVYGFDNLPDALNFGIDQGWESEFDVFSFEVDDAEKDPEYDPILDKKVETMLDSAYTESKPKIIITDNTLQDEKALEYYNENCKGKFEASVLPLLIYLSKEHHPMTKVIVESNKAELVEGVKSIVNNNFIED